MSAVLSFFCLSGFPASIFFSKMKLPLSPHLQVYKLPLTALLSISHRISGAISFIFTVLLVWKVFFFLFMPSSFVSLLLEKVFSGGFGIVLAFILTASFSYHLCNGIRHLFWDSGKFFSLSSVAISNNFVIVRSVLFFVLVWSLIIFL